MEQSGGGRECGVHARGRRVPITWDGNNSYRTGSNPVLTTTKEAIRES